jgi:hypothetical protein
MRKVESSFSDPDHAYCYAREALEVDGLLENGAELLITGQVRGHHAGCVRVLLVPLRRHLARLHPIHIRYEPEHPYAVILDVTCPRTGNRRLAKGLEARQPHIVMLLKERDGRPVLIGSTRVVPRPDGQFLIPSEDEALRKPAALSRTG